MRVWPVVLLLACSSKSDEPSKQPSEPAKPAAKAAEKPMAPEPVEKATPPKPSEVATAPKPPTDEDKARSAKYHAAMTRGRKLTDAKKYDNAIKAFDEAIEAKKGDARAVSERGFARLLAGDLRGASEDFDDAASASKDSRLLSQIWFNRGLVDEKRDQPDNARVDFYLANKMHPTDAAKRKLGDTKQVCPALVEHEYTNSWQAKTIDAADWLALAALMPLPPGDGFSDPPKTAVDTRKALGVVEPKLPAIAVTGHAGSGRVAYVVAAHGKGLRAIPVGEDGGGRCPGTIDFSVEAVTGSIVHVSGSELYEGGMTEVCPDNKDMECTGAPDEHYTEACFAGTPIVRDVVIDTESGKLVVISRPQTASGGEVTVKADPSGVHLSGLDCTATVPLP